MHYFETIVASILLMLLIGIPLTGAACMRTRVMSVLVSVVWGTGTTLVLLLFLGHPIAESVRRITLIFSLVWFAIGPILCTRLWCRP